MEQAKQAQARPVPAPRRICPEARAGNYQNVKISINNKNSCKKLNIDSENLHNNCTEKIQSSSQNKLILEQPNILLDACGSEEYESQPIYGPDANENVEELATSSHEPVYATPKPAPRQRTKPTNQRNETVVLRTAPEIPPKPLNIETTERCTNSIDFSKIQRNQLPADQSDISRSPSNTSLNFSESSQNSKFKSQSPGYVDLDAKSHSDGEDEGLADASTSASDDSEQSANRDDSDDKNLLRSLGNTSKLLGEAIGERVAFKAKEAKKQLDKNLKSSSEAIGNLSVDATARLKHAGKRFGTNFSLSRRDKTSNCENLKLPASLDNSSCSMAAMEFERRQTVPNTDVFNTIQFSSPLNRNEAGGGHTDLSAAAAAISTPELLQADDDGSYEVPRGVMSESRSPPSYDEALRDSPQRSSLNRQSPLVKNFALEAAKVVKQRYQQRQSSSSDSPSEGASRTSIDSTNLPSPRMPDYPPPALPQEVMRPPKRQKPHKNYEQIQLRRCDVSASAANYLRPNVDSAELHKLNQAAALAEREQSLLMRANIIAAEARTANPERSDSWEFYADDDNNNDEEQEEEEDKAESNSSPEPVYANQEATYGKLFEMATVGSNVLTPQSELARINEEAHCCANENYNNSNELDSCDGAVGGWIVPPQEVIKEFDPLAGKGTTLPHSNKSNELLLLEHMLEEETYGTMKREQDDVSMCTSEEDAAAAGKSETKTAATVVLPLASDTEKLQIVHQNAQLFSDSMENMQDDKPQPSKSLQVDLAPASRQRTNWFVRPAAGGKAAKLSIEGDSPPSYLEAIGGDGKPTSQSTITSPTSTAGTSPNSTLSLRFKQTLNAFSNVKIRVDAMKRKASFKAAAQRQSEVKVALQMVPRPSLSPLLVRYEGPLIRFPSGVVEDILKEMQNRKAILRDRQFQTFLDQEMKTPKECIPLEAITTLQCVSNSRVTDNSTHFYCFELTTSMPKNGNSSGSNGAQAMSSNPNLVMTSKSSANIKQQRVAHLYGVGKESERGVWMQKILESLSNSIPVKYTCHYYRAGWCYLKNSITSDWSGTWLVLRKNQRRLIFVTDATGNVEKMDLRKARCIVLKESDESIDNLHVEAGPMLMIDCPPYSVYMIMSSARETKIWRHIIREVAHNNGFSLSDQQLTRFDVPVIVDKCINFVYIHGSMSEGIYRKSGSENSTHKLMIAFRADAFNVEITRNEYNEHDVANVLKRFMRDLPERLLGKLTDSFMFVTELDAPAEKIPVYKELLARLSVIERETLRRIVGHLVFISSQQIKNKMSVQNLTMIWGPTLLAKKSDELIYSQKEADVLSDLILLYKNLFPCSPDEMKREQAMLMCLQKYYAAAETLKDSIKQSGDIKIWISLNPNPDNTTEEKMQVNATISPTKTAYELCREYATKMNLPTHQLTVYEVILNDSLERPLHHDIKVFDVILNWSYWPEEDRKHNYLVIRPLDLLREVQRAVKNLATVTPGKELRFADNRTKSFKALQCELRDGKIVVSKKDKNDKTTIVREIFLHSSTAYLGCERKRDIPWSWAITFVERTQAQIMRSRDAPYIGHVLAGSEWMDRTIWYSSIWYCLYGENILSPAEIIIK